MKRTALKRKTPLRTRTPIKRKRATPRRIREPVRCPWPGCRRRPSISVSETERICPVHAKKVADSLVGGWVKWVRDRRCVACGTIVGLEWAHVRTRGAHPALHYCVGPTTADPGNSVALCRADHAAFTASPTVWEGFVRARWPGLWTFLIRAEDEHQDLRPKTDLGAIIRTYRALVVDLPVDVEFRPKQ